jgi:integrase
MDGPERSLLYSFAVQTGLRVNETRQLKVNDFDFERSGGPIVKVRAAYSKTDEAAEQPLQPRLARKVKRFIQDRRKVGGAKVFGGAFKSLTVFTARALREDIEAAGLEYKTADGYADFHSLRHVFTTSIRGVDDTVKMGLTRHATREMLDTYDHGDEDLALKRAALSQVKHWGKVG